MSRLLLFLAAAWFWPTDGFAQEPPQPKVGSDAGHDSAVLEVVLMDLLTWPDSPLESHETTKRILFSQEGPADRPTVADVLDGKHAKKKWAKLSRIQRGLAREAAGDLVRRLEEKDAFKGFRPKETRIVIWDKRGADEKRDPRSLLIRPQVFRAYAPGYSRDRQLAIVRLTFPWSGPMHSGDGTYVLARKEGEWVVLIRVFAYYL